MFGDAFGGGLTATVPVIGKPQFLGVADPNALNPLAAAFGPPTLVSRVVPSNGGYQYVKTPAGNVVVSTINVSGKVALVVNVIPSNPAAGDFPIQKTLPSPTGGPAYFILSNNLGLPGTYVAVPTNMITPSSLSTTAAPSTHMLYNIDPIVPLSLTLPGGAGGLVGRTKVSDDNSPLPHDRIIFNYDDYNGVPLTPGGYDVHRFSVGFEKTFFDQGASFELRLPFASTLDNDIYTNGVGNTRSTEVGDLALSLKALVYRSEVLNVCTGLAIALPTADDVHVYAGNTQVLYIRNEDVILTPYVAFVLTPDDNLFFQNWYEVGVNTKGNEVAFNNGITGLQPLGRLKDQNLLQIDAQLGYWLIRNSSSNGMLRGLAPFVELHWNDAIDNAGRVSSGLFSISGTSNNFNELNMTVGVLAQIGDRINLSLGAAFPLLGGTNRTFDYQLGLHVNFIFGPTYRNQTPATAVSSF
jgi:hypothetical protein